MKNLLIRGNIKMGKEVFLFNLPPKKTCTPSYWCLHGNDGSPACYALRNNFLLPNVINGALERFEISKGEDFVERMIYEIQKNRVKYFRFHASGDFYNEEYVEKVREIVFSCPETLFRTSTRRRDLTSSIHKLNSLPNIIIRESLDNERSEPTMNLPFAAISSLYIVKRSDSYHCPNDCTECGYHCWKNSSNMDFDEH